MTDNWRSILWPYDDHEDSNDAAVSTAVSGTRITTVGELYDHLEKCDLCREMYVAESGQLYDEDEEKFLSDKEAVEKVCGSLPDEFVQMYVTEKLQGSKE